MEKLAQQADAIRVPVKNLAGSAVLANLTLPKLGQMYRNAHRVDAIKKVLTPLSSGLGEAAKLTAKLPASAVVGLAEKAGWYSIFGAWLQWRCWQANVAKIDALNERLKSQPGLNAEQKAAIENAIELTTLGLHDNYCGVAGGVSEVVGLGANSLRLAGTATIGFSVAAFAGAAGAFMNAAQNYHKGMAKRAEGSSQIAVSYFVVASGYFAACIGFGASGVEIITHWFLTRKIATKALETSLRGVAGAAFGGGVRLLGLSLTGWGLVLTVGSFTVEGIVGYYDRSALEQWVENSYFGTQPKYRGTDGKGSDPAFWDQEARAFADALKAAEVDGAAAA